MARVRVKSFLELVALPQRIGALQGSQVFGEACTISSTASRLLRQECAPHHRIRRRRWRVNRETRCENSMTSDLRLSSRLVAVPTCIGNQVRK